MRLVVPSYLCAALVPPAGLVLGIVVAVQHNEETAKHGVWIINAALVTALAWIGVIGLAATRGG